MPYLSNYVLFRAAKETPCNRNDDATKIPQPLQLKVFPFARFYLLKSHFTDNSFHRLLYKFGADSE